MRIDSLVLHNFRSHAHAQFEFDPRITVISGPNGSGKTSILEAIHVVARGKSFRDADADILQFGAEWWRTEGRFGDIARDMRYDTSGVKPTKEIVIEGVKRGRFMAKYALPVVLFEPDDLLLIHGSPSRRRRHIDTIVAQLHPGYPSIVRSYERALLQRNTLLKRGGMIDDTLFVWDVTLAELAAQILQRRQEIIHLLSPLVEAAYREIAQTDDSVCIEYSPALSYGDSQLQQSIVSLLASRHARDKLTGFTSVGPHRDDVCYRLRAHDMETTASRGEIRSVILALKLAETQLIEKVVDELPIVLLDDVFSELDESRRTALVHNLSHDEQIIITTTNSDIKGLRNDHGHNIALG